MFEKPISRKQTFDTVEDRLKNLSTKKDSYTNTRKNINEKLVKPKLVLEYVAATLQMKS